MSRKAIYCICGEGGGTGGPNKAYYKLEQALTGMYTVINYETIPRSISLNVANLMHIISTNITNFDEIYIIGWGMGSQVAVQVTYHVNNYIKADYVKGIVLISSPIAHTDLLAHINVTVIFIHGTGDKILPFTNSKKLYNKYAHAKHICLMDNQNHGYMMPDTDIAEVMKGYFMF